jgi:hypothetical protein
MQNRKYDQKDKMDSNQKNRQGSYQPGSQVKPGYGNKNSPDSYGGSRKNTGYEGRMDNCESCKDNMEESSGNGSENSRRNSRTDSGE